MVNTNRRKDADLDALHHVIERQEQVIAQLSTNKDFGCLARQALDLLLEDFSLEGLVAVYWDIDGLKQANERWGKADSNRRIKEAIQVRSTDCVAGQVFSGDEFIAFPPYQDAIEMALRIQDRLHESQMSATFVVIAPNGRSGAELLALADTTCAQLKAKNQRDMLYVVPT